MMKPKYRIKERNGVFTIQIYGYEIKGILWWRRKEWDWFNTSCYGGVFDEWYPSSNEFSSLEEAKTQIEYWNSDPVYHYL